MIPGIKSGVGKEVGSYLTRRLIVLGFEIHWRVAGVNFNSWRKTLDEPHKQRSTWFEKL